MVEDRLQVVSRQRGLVVEVDVLEHAGELLWVGAPDFAQPVVQRFTLRLLIGATDVVKELAGRDDDAVVHRGVRLDDLKRRLGRDSA